MPEFEGKINCIYIDPPYNTGNEGWVYNDAVNDPKIKKWLGQVVGKEGEDLSRHDKWLCMMYPRLKLLHRLLADDGVIFLSINEVEQSHLRLVMDEIFGAPNFISAIACVNNPKGRSDDKYIATAHESILIYRKTSSLSLGGFEIDEKIIKRYNKHDSVGTYREIDLRKTGDNDTRSDRPNMFYPFYFNQATEELIVAELDDQAPIGFLEILPMKSTSEEGCWRWGKENSQNNLKKLTARYMTSKKQWSIFEKDYLDTARVINPISVWDYKDVNSERGTEIFIKDLGFSKADFPNPKPLGTVARCIKLATKKDLIVLDSFAGSGTTAHAVLKLNALDGGNRRFICIEMMDYAETITAERVRRVMNGYGEGTKAVAGTGGSFDFYTVGEPLFLEDKNLNEAVGIHAIRDYVAYTEGIPVHQQIAESSPVSQYVIGASPINLWLFYYESDHITTLDIDFLAKLNIKALPSKPESYVIYADKCALNKDFLSKYGITFKRIPRDITKF